MRRKAIISPSSFSPSLARQYVSMSKNEYAPRPLRDAKNPLRQHVTRLSTAIVEANKLDEFIDNKVLQQIRKGAGFRSCALRRTPTRLLVTQPVRSPVRRVRSYS